MAKTLKSNNAEFINVKIKEDQKIVPKLTFGDPIEDLSPKISRNEFKKNMIIEQSKRSNIIESN